MIMKGIGAKACIAIIFLFCIQININTQAGEGCFEGFSSISCGGYRVTGIPTSTEIIKYKVYSLGC